MKSKILSQLRYRFLYIALSIVVIILVKTDAKYLIVIFAYVLYLLKNHKDILIFCLIVCLIYSTSVLYANSINIDESAQYDVVVKKVYINKNNMNYDGIIDGKMVKVYLSDLEEIKPGDLYTVKGELTTPINNTIPNTFNFKNYLLSKKIKYIIYETTSVYKGEEFNINIIPYKINQYIENKLPYSKDYVKTFILADKSEFDQDFKNNINMLGVSHLFAVSGLHVGLLVIIVEKLFKKMKFTSNKIEMVITFLLILYLISTGFAPSITRASLMFIFLVINKKLMLKLSSIDIISIIFILLIVLNPYYFFNIGFVLSFLVTLLILLGRNLITSKSSIVSLLSISVLSFFGTLPVVININYQINLISLFLNVILILIVSYIILPMSYFVFVFPLFDRISFIFNSGFNYIINRFALIDFFMIEGSFTNVLHIMIYYVLMMLCVADFERGKRGFSNLFLLGLAVVIIFNSSIINVYQRVVFLDVTGDSTFIADSFNRCNILIDTGEKDEYNSVISFLKSNNARKLDYLIISHMHSDHYGEANDIIEEINVKRVITNSDVTSKDDVLYNCGNISFVIYGNTITYENENNNSIIMSLFIADKHYLFTGDSENIRENDFMKDNSFDVDYLKVGHHGSITSSSDGFIDTFTPESVFIMVKRKNKHKHPSDIVINRYYERNIDVYRTDLLGSIEHKYLFGYETKKYYKP